MRSSVERIVVRNELATAEGGNALVLTLAFQPLASGATARAQWRISVADANGRQLLQQNYASYLPAQTTERGLSAFAEAAALSVIADVRRLAREGAVVAQKQ